MARAARALASDHRGGAVNQTGLRASKENLTKLADDLHDMRDHLDKQVERMDAIVDSIEAKWQGPTATAYRDLHRGAAEDAVRIRMVIQRLEQAVRLSRDGFSAQDLEIMERLRQIQASVDLRTEVNELSTPNADAAGPGQAPAQPRSGLSGL
ncbi:WXG100 family type VII secretion target [Streptomyces sp. NPDC057116]|uniref:WXG100 family type VII secretion target n=1 Tax=Streptomyces sp. NPDC057116 TaxID=3346023 RepID=UPI003640C0DF